ncbi:MAG: YdjY domain-containing protein [Gemmataceae bacterium]|nr:YdjY domain-containing protein [Gemmataceae bacterium]
MKHGSCLFVALVGAMLLSLSGCAGDDPLSGKNHDKAAKPVAAEAKKLKVGNNVYLEIQGDQRRVLIDSKVCLRQGQLEQFLTRKHTKEHESILTADVNAKDIHTALLAARAEPGNPVKFLPKYEPARGTTIKVYVEFYDADQKLQRLPAQRWIRSIKTQKDLEYDWVFAGSTLFQDPLDKTKPPFYAANQGDLICVSNFETAMLDLPIASPQGNDDLAFEAATERIPPLDTRVWVILEPVVGKDQGKKKGS